MPAICSIFYYILTFNLFHSRRKIYFCDLENRSYKKRKKAGWANTVAEQCFINKWIHLWLQTVIFKPGEPFIFWHLKQCYDFEGLTYFSNIACSFFFLFQTRTHQWWIVAAKGASAFFPELLENRRFTGWFSTSVRSIFFFFPLQKGDNPRRQTHHTKNIYEIAHWFLSQR